jgi:Tfp pilus assembly protein PilN
VLHTNLSTRPFYNTRIVRLGLTVVAVIAAGLTVFNAVELWRLQRANRELGQVVVQNENEARELRQKARTVQQSIDRSQLSLVDAAAREANALIDRRAFSWTELLNQFQATLPPSVRILSVQPQVDDAGQMLVSIRILSRQQEDRDTFIEALEKSGVFREVLSRSDAVVEDGSLSSVLQAYYHAQKAAIPPSAASEPGKDAPANRSAANVVAGGRP